MELGSRPSAAALRGRPIPFLGGWTEQLVVATTGRPLAFVFSFFSVTIRWPEQPSGRPLPFLFFSVMFAVRDDKKHTAKCVYRAICCRVFFAVRFGEKCTAKPLPCVLSPLPCAADARQSLLFPQ
jgi:hypothetical protein